MYISIGDFFDSTVAEQSGAGGQSDNIHDPKYALAKQPASKLEEGR